MPRGVRVLLVMLGLAVHLLARTLAEAQAAALASPEGAEVRTQPRAAPLSFGAASPGTLRLAGRWDSSFFVSPGYVDRSGLVWDPPITDIANELTLSVDLGSTVVRAMLPLGYTHVVYDSLPTIDQAELGDLTLDAYANVELDPTQRFLIGGGVALPTATDTYCAGRCTSRGMNVRTRAWQITFRDPAAWSDQTITLVPSIDYTLGVPWFLLHVVGSVSIFFPIDPNVGGPQPAARGAVDVMPFLDLSAALRIERYADVGASFLGWVIATVNENTPIDPPSGLPFGSPRTVRQFAQAAVTFFARTDPELDAPVGGTIELVYDLHGWHTTDVYAPYLGQTWSIHASLHGRLDLPL